MAVAYFWISSTKGQALEYLLCFNMKGLKTLLISLVWFKCDSQSEQELIWSKSSLFTHETMDSLSYSQLFNVQVPFDGDFVIKIV